MFSQKLRETRESLKITQQFLADKIGVTRQSVQKWESGKMLPTMGLWGKIEEALGVQRGWCISHIDTSIKDPAYIPPPMDQRNPGDRTSDSGWKPSPRREPRKVPVISWVQAGAWSETEDPFQPGYAEEFVLILENCGPNTFALRVVGDSMEPEFVAGDILLVDPACDWSSRDYIIAKNGDDEATFKQIVTDGGKIFLNPLNRRYPVQDMTGKNFKVIGRVIQKVKKY